MITEISERRKLADQQKANSEPSCKQKCKEAQLALGNTGEEWRDAPPKPAAEPAQRIFEGNG